MHAADRLRKDYNIYGFPTNFFDGGYDIDVGAGSIPSAKATYEASILNCGARVVPDIEASLTVNWIFGAKMQIDVSIQNNETSLYEGFLHVYVNEIESSMGWKDSGGVTYTFPFLDYAFDEPIQIPAGGTWQGSTLWDGAMHDDGYGHNFGHITANNIMVIAAVFNAQWHQGYAYPPNQNPFDAYYLDEAVGAVPIAEFFVDNEDPECFVVNGQWKKVSYSSAYNGTALYHFGGTGGNQVGFRVDRLLPAPGSYEVQIHKFEHPYMNMMATNALHKVYYKGGQSSWIPIDLSTPGNEWISLGTYDFDSSSVQGVLVTDHADGIVAADAVRMIPK